MEEENKKVVLTFLEQMHAPPADLLSDNFELVVIGAGPSGARRTPAEIRALQEATYGAAAGEFTIIPLKVIAEGDDVVVEAKGNLPLKNGETYANDYSFHFELSDNKITKLTNYCDTAYAERMFPGL